MTQSNKQEYLEKRLEKLKADNHALREKISALKEEKQELQRLLKNRNKVFSSISTGVILVQDGKVVDTNRAGLDLIGHKSADVIGHDFIEFVHPDRKDTMKAFLNKWVAGKRAPHEIEMNFIGKAGDTIECEMIAKRVRISGRLAFCIGLLNLEKRKQREKRLVRSKKMEALTSMATGLKRDVNQSIEGITKNIRLIRDSESNDDRYLEQGLENMELGASRLIHTARNLDSLLKKENNPSEIVSFDIRPIVKEAMSSLSADLKEDHEGKGAKINLKTYLRSVSPVAGDPVEIQDMIMHMLRNAIEAMPTGGDLYITTEEDAGHVCVYIQDSGKGIQDHIKERIFDPFFTSQGEDRAGLGLSLARAIAERHRGEIEVMSKKDQGTVVIIRLPVARREQKQIATDVKRKIKTAHILIIEEEKMIRELLSQLLESKGYRIVTAISGSEGLNKLKRKHFDMVIADSHTPGTTESSFLSRIRKINEETSVVTILSQGSDGGSKRSKGSAPDLTIIKPIDMNRLVDQIPAVLMKRVARDRIP